MQKLSARAFAYGESCVIRLLCMFVVAAAAAAVVVVLVVVVVAVVAPISKECAYAYMPVCIYTCMYVHVHPCYNEDALCHAAYDQAKTPNRDHGGPETGGETGGSNAIVARSQKQT